MTWLARYVPHARAGWYAARGWKIRPLMGAHGLYSVLAVKRVKG